MKDGPKPTLFHFKFKALMDRISDSAFLTVPLSISIVSTYLSSCVGGSDQYMN